MRPADHLKERCPRGLTKEGIVVFKLVNDDLPEVMVYRGPHGDYIVDDDYCTCKAFLRTLDTGNVEPCKHICAEKRVTPIHTYVLDNVDFDMLLLSLLFHERSITLNLLTHRKAGEEYGKEKEEEEDHS